MAAMTTRQRLFRSRWLLASIIALFAISVGIWLQGKDNEVTIINSPDAHMEKEQVVILDQEAACACPTTADSTDITAFPGLQGNVSDCCCSFSDIERANLETVRPLLQKVVETPFFSHFKMDLCSSCQLWDDAPLCILRDCGVCECKEPPQWANDVEWMPKQTGPDCEHLEDQIVMTVDHHVQEDWTADPSSFLDFSLSDNEDEFPHEQYHSKNEGNENAAVVVDLRLNPERYTGYSGQSAEKVWHAIHMDNCFQTSPSLSKDHSKSDDDTDGDNGAEEACTLTPEQRVYNRIISGLHSSISLHIAHSYCLEVDPDRHWECKTWGPNATLAQERVLDHPDRLENLYVAFAMVLRAVQKAGSAVTAAVPRKDELFSESLVEWTESLLPELVKLEHNCPVTFDESSLFAHDDADNSKTKRFELQRRFRHLQQIMECVGCDRCKLWGTLQTLGIGTALRVLLGDHYEDEGTAALNLSRQEAVALVHTLERLSSSLVYANELRRGN